MNPRNQQFTRSPGLQLLNISYVHPYTCRRRNHHTPSMFLVYFPTSAGRKSFYTSHYLPELLLHSLHLQEGKSLYTCRRGTHHLPGLLLHVSGVLPYICRTKKFLYLNCFCMFLVYFFKPAGGEKALHLQEGKSFCTSHHLP